MRGRRTIDCRNKTKRGNDRQFSCQRGKSANHRLAKRTGLFDQVAYPQKKKNQPHKTVLISFFRSIISIFWPGKRELGAWVPILDGDSFRLALFRLVSFPRRDCAAQRHVPPPNGEGGDDRSLSLSFSGKSHLSPLEIEGRRKSSRKGMFAFGTASTTTELKIS